MRRLALLASQRAFGYGDKKYVNAVSVDILFNRQSMWLGCIDTTGGRHIQPLSARLAGGLVLMVGGDCHHQSSAASSTGEWL